MVRKQSDKIKKYLLWGIGSLILALIFCAIFCNSLRFSWHETTRQKFLLYSGEKVDLFQENKVSQTFVAHYPGLSQIEILFNGTGDSIGQQVGFHLKLNCNNSNDLVYLTAELPATTGLYFYPFTFPPLDDSAGQSYCVLLDAPRSTFDTRVKVQLSSANLYPEGQLTTYPLVVEEDKPVRHKPDLNKGDTDALPYKLFLPIVFQREANKGFPGIQNADMGFLLRYNGLLRPTAQVFLERLTANKPYIWGSGWFYGGLLILYAALLFALFYVGKKTIQLG